MTDESMTDEALYRQIVDLIASELGLNPDNFEIDLDDGHLTIWGEVPSIQDQEELERLLFDSLDLEELDYDVVVDEDLQTQQDQLGGEQEGYSEDYELDQGPPDISSTQSPRRQF